MTQARFTPVACFLAAVALAGPLGAETKVRVDGPSVRLADVDPGASAELGAIDLGRAPPPGGSRVLTRREIRQRVRDAGKDPAGVNVPPTVRVESPADRWSPAELAVRADAVVRAALPFGVSLVKIGATQGAVVPPGTHVASAKAIVPHGIGRHELTVVAELRRDDEVVGRAPLTLVVEVSAEAFAPILRKGDRLTLVVEQGNARIGATGVALADANQGDSIWFRVTSTGKVLKARVASREVGVVVEL